METTTRRRPVVGMVAATIILRRLRTPRHTTPVIELLGRSSINYSGQSGHALVAGARLSIDRSIDRHNAGQFHIPGLDIIMKRIRYIQSAISGQELQ